MSRSCGEMKKEPDAFPPTMYASTEAWRRKTPSQCAPSIAATCEPRASFGPADDEPDPMAPTPDALSRAASRDVPFICVAVAPSAEGR